MHAKALLLGWLFFGSMISTSTELSSSHSYALRTDILYLRDGLRSLEQEIAFLSQIPAITPIRLHDADLDMQRNRTVTEEAYLEKFQQNLDILSFEVEQLHTELETNPMQTSNWEKMESIHGRISFFLYPLLLALDKKVQPLSSRSRSYGKMLQRIRKMSQEIRLLL